MSKLVNDNLLANPWRQDDFIEEFNLLDVVGRWADVSADTGAAPSLATDGESAVILTTAATDNNECLLVSNQTWDVAQSMPLTIDIKMRYAESNTDDANILMGLVSSAAAVADVIADNGGGPPASYSGAVFFKVDGGTVWNVESSVAGTQTTTATNKTAGGASYQNFRIEIRPIDSTTAEVVFLIGQDGGSHFTQCKDSSGNVIKHTLTYTSFAACKLVLGAKAGSANGETPRFDYVRVSQVKP